MVWSDYDACRGLGVRILELPIKLPIIGVVTMKLVKQGGHGKWWYGPYEVVMAGGGYVVIRLGVTVVRFATLAECIQYCDVYSSIDV